MDNIDINEETLSGMGTFHATQYAAFRRVEDGGPKIDVQITPKSDRKLNLKIPSELHELQEVDLGNEKPEPVMKGAVMDEWCTPGELCIDESFEKDLAWILVRLAPQHPEIQQVPGWCGFNQMLSPDKSQTTMVGPLPIINAPAHEFETLWTVIQKCKAMTKLRNGSYTVVTMDEGLYNKAIMLQWAKTEAFKDVIIILGGFHTQMNFSKATGKYVESSGIPDMWVESEVFGEATAQNIVKGKHWNRVARAHKISYEALWRVLWPLLLTWAHDNGEPVDESSLEEMARRLANEFSTRSDDLKDLTTHGLLISQVIELIKKFDEAHQDNPTFCYWRKYMNLVSILLRFTRALREGDWELYLSSFAEMLPWFAAYDHVNYTRWGVVYLAEMRLLPQTAPEVYLGFLRGDFVTRETHHTFNQIPDDQALEHVNKSGKTAGGLVGITRTDSARDRWCLTYNEKAQLSEDTKAMFGIGSEKECDHRDSGKSRMRQDEEDVLRLVCQFKKYDVSVTQLT